MQTWVTSLVDSEKVVQYFYETCFQANESCALRQPSDQNWMAIRTRVDALIKDLDEYPRPVIVPGTTQTILVTGDDIRIAFQIPLDEPVNLFPALAELLSDAIGGSFSALPNHIDVPTSAAGCPPRNKKPAFHYNWAMDAAWSVLCGDGHD
jgi:hypothetical protein